MPFPAGRFCAKASVTVSIADTISRACGPACKESGADLKFPEPLRTAKAVMHDGAVIYLRQHGNPNGPRLALSHGNGLATDGYLPFWGPLRDRYELIVFDF